MASDSDLEAYFNQLSRKSHNLQKQNIESDAPSLSHSSLTPTFKDDDNLLSKKVTSKQNVHKKKVETVPGSLLDIKSLSEKYSKSKAEIARRDIDISSVEESYSSYNKESVYNGRKNKGKVNVKEYIKHNAVSKKPKSKVSDVDSSMDEELAKYLNETSLHDEEHDGEINKSPQYYAKRHSLSNSSSSGNSFLNLNNMQTLEDILGTRSNDNSESVNVDYDQVKSHQKEDSNVIKNKSVYKRGSIHMATQDSSKSVEDKDEKGSLLRNFNSSSIFHSKGQNDNSSFSNIPLHPLQNSNQWSKQKEISTTEAESVSIIDESVIEESENIVEESIPDSDTSIEENTESKNDTNNFNVYESVSESSRSIPHSNRERTFENNNSSSRNETILDKSETSEEIKNKNKKISVSGKSKHKLRKASEVNVSFTEENSGVKNIGQHTASSSKKKSIRKESKVDKNKISESEQKDSSRQGRHSRHRKKKRYIKSSSSSDSNSSDGSNSISDSELLNISKKLYQKLKHRTHTSYYKREARKLPEWNYSSCTPSVYGVVFPPSFSGVGSNNFGIMNHTAILRQQVELTRMFMDSQRALYSAYTSALHSSKHFTTIKDTEKYIKKNRKPTLTFEEALKLAKEEMKSSH